MTTSTKQYDALFCRSSLQQNAFNSMTLTEQQQQQPSSRRVLAFENVVFKNDNLCDHANGTTSVTLPIKAQRVSSQTNHFFARLSQRFSHRTKPIEKATQQTNTFTTSPPSSSIERQNSSESDLSLSKLDLANEYSVVVDGQNSLNTSRQTSELNLAERNSSTTTSQRVFRSIRNIYSRFSHVHSNPSMMMNSSSSSTDTFCCCFSKRTSSPNMPVSSHQRFFT